MRWKGRERTQFFAIWGMLKKRRQVGKQVPKSGDLRAICARDWHLEVISTYTAFKAEVISTYTAFKAMKTERVF